MIDITHKPTTLRSATAQAVIKVSRQETVKAIETDTVPKGNVFEMAKAAGLLGVKKTSDILPDCHPMPIEYAAVEYSISGLEITVKMHVKAIYRTGVEVEAMHGASVVALTVYDMLKPIDKAIEISSIKLLSKKGGKSDFTKLPNKDLKAVVVVCSDSISSGKKKDKAGNSIKDKLEEYHVKVAEYIIIPDEIDRIRTEVNKAVEVGMNMMILTGGTGLSDRDVTREALAPLIEREIPGIAEAMRSYGQDRTPCSMLSRSLAGIIGKTLILALPGSTGGAIESMDALFPPLLHIFDIMNNRPHD